MRQLRTIGTAILCMAVTFLYGNAQEVSFDTDLYLELTTIFESGQKFDIAVDYPAWADFNADGVQDQNELFIPQKEGKIQRFYSTHQGAKTIKIYGAFTELILREDGINSIDLSRMTQLVYLELKSNNLSTIDLSNLKNLESLSLRENFFTSVDLSNQPKLELLEVIYNEFEEVDLSNKPNMYFLGIAHNRFTEQSSGKLISDLPTMERNNPGDIFAHFPVETEQNVITTDQVLEAKSKNWNVYTWSMKANSWVPYAGERGIEEISLQPTLRADYHDGTLIIYGTTAGSEISLYDLSGAQLLTFEGDAEHTLYRTSGLPEGVYLVQQGAEVAKLMVVSK